jgi:carboxyl-terminal processing protease
MKRALILPMILCLAVFFLTADSDNDWQIQRDKYQKIFRILQDKLRKPPDARKIVFASIHGLLKTLDPHSYFLDPPMLKSMMEDQRGNYYGIGIRIIKYEDKLTILSTIKDTPAFKQGLKPGDVIIQIENQLTKGIAIDQLVRKLRGAKGSTVTLKIQRKGFDNPIIFRIKREEIPLNSISHTLAHPAKPEIGYISIRTFGKTTPDEFQSNLNNLILNKAIKGLILDLRGNSGGLLQSAIHIADFFLEKGKTVVSIKGKKKEQIFKAQKDDQFEGFPLSILINRQSASASEIVASAMQFHGKATIIGSRSWGKGLVETVYRLPLNCAMALTSAKYYTPGNKSLQRDYLEYDRYFSIFEDDEYDRDTTIQGGVIPDILVQDLQYPRPISELIFKGVFFRFTRTLMASGTPIRKNFYANERIMARFKNFLTESRIKFKPQLFDEFGDEIRYEIMRDALTHRFSVEEGVKVFLQRDPVVRAATAVLMNKIGKGAQTWKKQTILSNR